MRQLLIIGCLATTLMASAQAQAQAQTQDTEDADFGSEDDFGDDFGDFDFDASAFDDSGIFDAEHEAASPFTFRLSHQTVSHLNSHSQTLADGSHFQRRRQIEINRLDLTARYQHAFGNGWLIQSSAYSRLHLPGDYRHEASDGIKEESRLNELFVQNSGERHSFSLGRQTIVWGETLGNSVLDVINHTEYRDLTIIDLEDARLNQWLVNWDWFNDAGRLSSFINLYPEFNKAPVDGSPLAVQVPRNLPSYSRSEPLFELGTRWSRSFQGSDLAIMAAWLYENDIHYLPDEQGMNAISNDFFLLGISANRAIGRLLLTLDIAFSEGLLTPASNAGRGAPLSLETRNRLGSSAGLEYAISNTQQFSLSVAAERFLDRRDKLTEEQQLLEDGINGNVLLRYSNSLDNDNLLLAATAQHALDGAASLLSLDADYRINDQWGITGQLILTHAARNSALAQLNQDVRLGLTIRYNFQGR